MINPATPLATLDEVLEFVDFVLVMSVNPGFGGQKFIPYALDKVRQLAAGARNGDCSSPLRSMVASPRKTLAKIIDAGVDWVVAGSAIFRTVDPADTFEEMRRIAGMRRRLHGIRV